MRHVLTGLLLGLAVLLATPPSVDAAGSDITLASSGLTVFVCHVKTGKGKNAKYLDAWTLGVTLKSALGHLRHGDSPGECE